MENIPTLKEWDTLTCSECGKIAQMIGEKLPPSFRYMKLERCQLANVSHRIAFFEWNPSSNIGTGILFAFLPGGQMTLGYDKKTPFLPSSIQLQSWQEETVGQGYTSDTLDTALEKFLLPVRRVHIPPILIQVVVTNPATHLRLQGARNRRYPLIHRSDILALLEQEGFRLPSSDEWEYACGAGERSLFRWGNHTPQSAPHTVYRMGIDHIPGEWNLHLKSNAFGLYIGNDPYKWEFCTEPEYIRGGDGGSSEHAGAGTFAEWLVFATSFCRRFQTPKESAYHIHYRRVYDLE